MAEAKKKLVLTLCIEEGESQHQHSFVEVEVPLRKGAEEREIVDALQRGVHSAFTYVKKEGKL